MSKIFKCSFCNGTGNHSNHLPHAKPDYHINGGTGKSNVDGSEVTGVFCSDSSKNTLNNKTLCCICEEREITTVQAIQNVQNAMFLKASGRVAAKTLMQ